MRPLRHLQAPGRGGAPLPESPGIKQMMVCAWDDYGFGWNFQLLSSLMLGGTATPKGALKMKSSGVPEWTVKSGFFLTSSIIVNEIISL